MRNIIRLLSTFTSFIFFSSFFIAFCAVALIFTTHLVIFGDFDRVSESVVGIVFAGVVLIYNYNVVFRNSFQANSDRKKWMVGNQGLLLSILLIATLVVIIAATGITFNGLVFITHLFFISLIYGWPLKWKNRALSFRSIPLIKPFLIAYVWSAITVIFPLIESGKYFLDLPIVWIFVSRFIFILALVLPFDLRDYSADKQINLKTIPIVFGVKFTRLLIYALLLFYFVISTIIDNTQFIIIAKGISVVLAILFTALIHDKRNDFFYTIAIDGIMLLQFLIMYLLFWIIT